MIRSLQSLRAFGAIMIFAHHFAFKDSPVTGAFGDYAVVLFFMLSGFVLMMANDKRDRVNTGRFFWSRFKRIAPLYYASLLLQLWVLDYDFDWNFLLPTLLMIQSWSPDPDVYFGFYPLTWFVSSLMFCYLAFPTLHRILKRYPRSYILILIGGAIAYGYILYRIPWRWTYYGIYIFPPMQLPSFTLGMILYLLIGKKRFNFSPYIADILVIAVVLASYLFLFEAHNFKIKYTLSSYYWLIVFAVMAIFTMTSGIRCVTTRLLSLKPLVMLGNASFSFYLLHGCWIQWSRETIQLHNIQLSESTEFILGLLILIPLSLLIHRLFFPHRL